MKDHWRRDVAAAIILAAHCSIVMAQDAHLLALTGASGIEELDESVIERYETLERHRVHINTASRADLISSGLFSPFQVAAIDDWRRSSGDILSLTELGSIDGFTPALAAHLAPYVDFSTRAGIGRSSLNGSSSNDLICRFQTRKDDGEDVSTGWGLKYRYSRDNCGSLAIAARNSYGCEGMAPETWSFCASIQGKRYLDRLIIGDFNAHFGQGLALWSGFSLSGAGTVDSFCKRASGISPSWSFGAMNYRGTAASFAFGRWTVTGVAAFPGLRAAMEKARSGITILPAANIAWLGRKGQFSVTGYAHGKEDAKVSADARWHHNGFDLYGEASLDAVTGALSGISGLIWSPKWQHRYAAMVRTYPKTYTSGQAGAIRAGSKVTDETGATLGIQLKRFSLTADAAWFPSRAGSQLKFIGQSSVPLTEKLELIPRMSLRIKDSSIRADMRTDFRWSSGPWTVITRTDLLRCRDWAWLQYLECGFRQEKVSVWLRTSVFRIDNWDDRIHVYERDAPGSFNVPAYHGRGVAASAVCGWKWAKQKLHLRASWVHYASDKPSRVELKCQYSLLL